MIQPTSMLEALQRGLYGLGGIGTALEDKKKNDAALAQAAATKAGTEAQTAGQLTENQQKALTFQGAMKQRQLLDALGGESKPAAPAPGQADLGMGQADTGPTPSLVAPAAGMPDDHAALIAQLQRENGQYDATPEMVKAKHAATLKTTQNAGALSDLDVAGKQTENATGAFNLGQANTLAPFRRTEAQNQALASGFAPAQAAANVKATVGKIDDGKFAPVTLAGNRLGIMDTQHGTVKDSGEEVQPKNLSAQTMQNAQGKLTTLAAMRMQLKDVQDKFDAIKGGVSSGKLTGFVPTEKGEQFDKAVAALKQTARQLTRTPGEGSMSDYETKLSQMSLPNRHDYDSVTQQSIDQLNDLANVIGEGYKQMVPASKTGAPAGTGSKFKILSVE